MKAINTLIFLSLCFGSIAVTAADLKKARPESVGMSSERLERIRPIMQEYVDQNQLAGVTTM
ncbi:MAG: hypothetical protein ACJAX5_003039, partial [Patiriisocius sp.]